MYKISFSLFLTVLLISGMASGQERSRNSLEFTPQVSLGVFTANHKLTGTSFGGELIYHINVSDEPRQWVRAMHLKSIDVMLDYKNMGNIKLAGDPEEGLFGDTYAALAGLNIALLKISRAELLFTPAFGIGYAQKTYFTNKNPLIGSHINFTSKAGIKLSVPVSASTGIAAGLDVLHYSNAAFRVPNNGMNLLNVSMGIVHAIGDRTVPDSGTVRNFQQGRHSIDIAANIGRRGVYQSKDGYFRTGLYTGYNYRISSILAASAGIDAVYYHSVFDPANFNHTYQSFATSYDHWRVGAALGPDIWMGRLALMIKYGYYLHYNSYRNNHTYWTAGLKYNLTEWAAVQAKIYVHKTEADYAGFGLILTPTEFFR
ncbi:acyloxyacyl hydrolase [Pedobacter sp. JY14-1]|uniref:acyloxyacyl hydrolase n=1 Tax=Pedobacter sp. JY14-1 TaxID=3034151 RepID=UPI0023E09C37|nr:acyloxyacyl hydrolase [Pedobacter sp. JY14-1]